MADNIPNFKCAIPSTTLNNALFGGQSAYSLLGPDGIPQTALANLGAGVRPNLLDNAYFAGPWQLPINQLGNTSWTGSAPYVNLVDRWLGFHSGGGATFSLSNAGIFLPAASAYVTVLQRLTQSNAEMVGKTYTVSAVVDGEVITGTGAVTEQEPSGTVTFFSGTGTNGVIVRLRCSSVNGMFFEVYAPHGGVTITACKLEEGEGQTLVYQDGNGVWQLLPQPDMDYATQLTKCLRYQLLLTKNTLASGRTFFSDETSVVCFLPTPTAMRINPTFVGSMSEIFVYADGSTYTAISVQKILASNNGLSIAFSIPAGVGVRQSVTVNFPSGVYFDANL